MEGVPTLSALEPSANVAGADLAFVRRTAAMLQAGVPLTLLMDLAWPDGLSSSALYAEEGAILG